MTTSRSEDGPRFEGTAPIDPPAPPIADHNIPEDYDGMGTVRPPSRSPLETFWKHMKAKWPSYAITAALAVFGFTSAYFIQVLLDELRIDVRELRNRSEQQAIALADFKAEVARANEQTRIELSRSVSDLRVLLAQQVGDLKVQVGVLDARMSALANTVDEIKRSQDRSVERR